MSSCFSRQQNGAAAADGDAETDAVLWSGAPPQDARSSDSVCSRNDKLIGIRRSSSTSWFDEMKKIVWLRVLSDCAYKPMSALGQSIRCLTGNK